MMAGMITLILTGLLRVLRTRRALVLENLALRHQLAVLQRTAPRPRLRTADRLLWVLLSRLWSGWTDAVSVVQPATVIRWQRSGFKLVWTWKSRRHGPGRPAVAPEIRALIRRMSKANPLWGAPRIHGELQKLGVEISQAAVSKYVVRHRRPPSQTWRTFLDNHVGSLVSVDFFVVPTVMCKVLFVFVVLAHERRRVLHINVTDAPTAQWTAQQLVEAFPWETAPRYVLRDRDAVYGVAFSRRVQTMGIHEVKIAPRSPWQNPYVERLIGTLRRECLDHVVVLNEAHLHRLLHAYLAYYHGARTHLSLAKDAPDPRPVERLDPGRIVETPMVGGPPSSLHSPGGVRSFRPAGCTRRVSRRSAGPRGSRSSSALRLSLHKGVSLRTKTQLLWRQAASGPPNTRMS
jgi:putative transposase